MYDIISLYDINNNTEFTLNLNGVFDCDDEQTQTAFVILNLKETNVKKLFANLSLK